MADYNEMESGSESTPEGGMEENDENTTLIPTSLVPEGCKVGDTYKIEVVGKYDDELEIKVHKSKDKDEPKPEKTADERMDEFAMQ